MSAQPKIRPADFSEQEWEVRCDLAACYRAFVRYGWTDFIYTHISARHPLEPGHYLINPYGLLFEEITASNLVVVDFDGNLVRGEFPYNDAGHAIHSAVLKARADVNWVLHSHTRAGMAVSCMQQGLMPLTQAGMALQGQVSYHRYDLQEPGSDECERLAADLGPVNYAMMLHNHGLLTCAPTVGKAFSVLYTLESACKVQVDVMNCTDDPILPDASAVDKLIELVRDDEQNDDREWAAVRRMVERADPSYKT